MEFINLAIVYAAKFIEVLGVLTILVGTLLALGRFIFDLQKTKPKSFLILRQELGKAILLGLEILVAADIIATVVTEPTLKRVLTLGVIVVIRTFLSLSIQVEIEGRFPWQSKGPNEI